MAIIGRPNVGKSSLLNRVAGQCRAVVDNVAGTTVDPADELVEVAGTVYRFIDTARLRRRVKEAPDTSTTRPCGRPERSSAPRCASW